MASSNHLGTRVTVARKNAGLSPDELARAAALSADEVRDIEEGRVRVGSVQAVRLAKALSVSPGSFLHASIPAPLSQTAPLIFFRKHTVADASEADLSRLAAALQKAMNVVALGRAPGYGTLPEVVVPTRPKPWQEGYDLANQLRKHLARSGPLRNLRRTIEDQFGILVVDVPFDNEVQGAAARSGEARLIALNRALEREPTLRFVLAHELCHHLCDFTGDAVVSDSGLIDARFDANTPPAEQRANAFAAMLLAPEQFVRSLVGQPPIQSTEKAREATLKVATSAGLGYLACAWHLKNLKYWDEQMVRSLDDFAPSMIQSALEDPTTLNGLERRVAHAVENGRISEGRARELLGGRWDDIAALRR